MELSKPEASEYLGISTRALERYTQQGKIGVKYVKGTRGKQARYQQSDLDRLKEELDTTVHKPTIEVTMPLIKDAGLTTLLEKIFTPLSSQIAALTEAVQSLEAPPPTKPTVAIENKLLLTLKEVQALTGLSREILREAIEQKQLKAKIIGKAWRITRGDLEDYIENL